MIKLETDLRSVQITSKTNETASYVYASYLYRCPIPRWKNRPPYDLTSYSLTLHTFICDVYIKRLEPGVFYRLPDAACPSLGARESLSLIPLHVEFVHSPYVDFVEDEHGRAYAPDPAVDADKETTRISRLCYGSWAVCGLLPADRAREWAGLSDVEWRVHSLFNKAHDGLDPSWQPLRTNGPAAISFEPPLLRKPIAVSRETV